LPGSAASAEPSPAEARKTLHRRSVPDGVPVQRKRRALTGRSQKEPCTDESRTGCPFSAKRSVHRGRSRRRRHIRRSPDGVPVQRQTLCPPRPKPKKTSHPTKPGRVSGRRHATPSAAETEKDLTRQLPDGCPVVTALQPPRPKPKKPSRERLPDGARSAPRAALRGRSRRRRYPTSSGRVPDPAPQLAVAANSHPTRRRHRTASRSRTRSRSPENARARPPDTGACRAATRDRSGGSASHPAHLEVHFHHAAMRTPRSRAAMVSPPRREHLYGDRSSGRSRDRSDRRATVARAEAPGRAAAIRSGRGGWLKPKPPSRIESQSSKRFPAPEHPCGMQAPFHGVWHPTTLAVSDSDLHQVCLTWLCCAFRLSQPPDALIPPETCPALFHAGNALGFSLSEVFPPR
jgi:hypothetical protein